MSKWNPSSDERSLILDTVAAWVAECRPAARITKITRPALGGIDDLFAKGDFLGESTRFAAFAIALPGGVFYRLEILFDADSRLVSFGIPGFKRRWHRELTTEKLVWNLSMAPVFMLTLGGSLDVPLAAFQCSGTQNVLHTQFCSVETVERSMPSLLLGYPSARLRKTTDAAYIEMGSADLGRLQAA